MQSLFEKFTNKKDIKNPDIPFGFTELTEIYCKTDRKTFIQFMEYYNMTTRISENNLNFDIILMLV